MKYYTLEALEKIYQHEWPGLSDTEVKKRAKHLHQKLNTMDVSWRRSNRRFYQNNELV